MARSPRSPAGPLLKRAREAAGYRLCADVARALGITRGHVSMLETGAAFPSIVLLGRMAQLYSMDARALADVVRTAAGGPDPNGPERPRAALDAVFERVAEGARR